MKTIQNIIKVFLLISILSGLTACDLYLPKDDEILCDIGYILVDDECVLDEQPLTCEDGYSLVDDECVLDEQPLTCEDGYSLVDNECVLDDEPLICEDGYTLVDEQCVLDDEPLICEDGYILVGDECVLDVTTDFMNESTVLNVIDYAEDYTFSALTLQTYTNKEDSSISYVSIEEFLQLVDEGLVQLIIQKDNSFKLNFSYDVPYYLTDEYGDSGYIFEMEFLADENQFKINDTNMFSAINEDYDFDYYTYLIYDDMTRISEDPSLTIDLDDYGMDIVKEDGMYYIPLYLANLFLTGASLNVYEMGTDIYIFDSNISVSVFEEFYIDDSTVTVSDIALHTENYLELYFDYFYGLIDYKGIDSYTDIIESYNLTEQNTFEDFHTVLEQFINDQNDLHTRILSVGYTDQDFEFSTDYIEGTKIFDYKKAYNDKSCDLETEEMTIEYIYGIYYVKIRSFTLETVNLLKEFNDFYRGRDVVIDVSCNPGGTLLGVLELLTYMTNEPIEINSINPATGEMNTDSFISNHDRALDANFYVITSNSSYSAANLFASIVKDMGLAVIIGEDTLGGASAIQLTVLPDGSILVSSSNYTLLNLEGTVIEDGISVDIEKEFPIDWSTYAYELDTIYNMSYDYTLDVRQVENTVFIDFEDTLLIDSLDNVTYKLKVQGEFDGLVWLEEDYTDDFNFDFTMDYHYIAYDLVIEVSYSLNGETIIEEIFIETFDDHYDYVSEGVYELVIGETVSGGKHNRYDLDCFKIVITEAGMYRISLNYGDFPYVKILDSEGNYLYSGLDFDLTPGTYYAQVEYPSYILYEVELIKLVDDTLEGTEIDIPLGTSTHSLYVDYSFDPEWFEFTVTEQTLMTFSLDLDEFQYYEIRSINNRPINDHAEDIIGNKEMTFYINPGTYKVQIITVNPGTVTLTTTATTDFVDYTDIGDLDPDRNYGELVIGENIISFEATGDIDMYTLTLTENASIAFDYDSTLGFMHRIYPHHYSFVRTGDIIYLEAGVHYFEFQTYDYMVSPTMTYSLVVIDDTYDDDIVKVLEFGVTVNNTFISEDDIDYFEFTITEMGAYIFTTTGRDLMYRIYDEDYNMIYQTSGNRTYSFLPGTYTIEMGLFGASFSSVEFVTMMIDYQVSDDEYVDLMGLDLSEYTVLGEGYDSRVSSSLEYEYDYDIFIFYLDETTVVNVECLGDVYTKIYGLDGESYSTKYGVELEAGTYYLMIYSRYGYYDKEYEVWIAIYE